MRFRTYLNDKFNYWGFIEEDGKMQYVAPPKGQAEVVLSLTNRATNIKDKNGNEIYEGDWIKCNKTLSKDKSIVVLDPAPNKPVVVVEVTFKDGDGFYLRMVGFEPLINMDTILFDAYEIIGNCFQGPDKSIALMKKKDLEDSNKKTNDSKK